MAPTILTVGNLHVVHMLCSSGHATRFGDIGSRLDRRSNEVVCLERDGNFWWACHSHPVVYVPVRQLFRVPSPPLLSGA
jgi:hypothetical protein